MGSHSSRVVNEGQLEAFTPDLPAFQKRRRSKPFFASALKNHDNQRIGRHLVQWVSYYGDFHHYDCAAKAWCEEHIGPIPFLESFSRPTESLILAALVRSYQRD